MSAHNGLQTNVEMAGCMKTEPNYQDANSNRQKN